MRHLYSVFVAFGLTILGLASPAFGQGDDDGPIQKMRIEALWSADRGRPGDQVVLGIRAQFDPGWYAKADASQLEPGGYSVPTEVKLELPDGVIAETVRYPKKSMVLPEILEEGVAVEGFWGKVVFFVPMRLPDTLEPGTDLSFEVGVYYQACDDTLCINPATATAQAVLPIVAKNAVISPQHEKVFEGVATAVIGRSDSAVSFDLFGYEFSLDTGGSFGLILLLLVAMLGGLLLNFTPCVLPVIPIKIMSLSHAAGDRRRCLTLGIAMSVGIVGFWLALAVLVTSVAKFTAINQLFQYPSFTIGVGVVIALLAIGMCGLFSIQLPSWLMNLNPRDDTHVGSFGLGIMTAILSTPCTAPFMGAAAAWAIKQPASTTLLTFGAIGAGMALPYQILAAFPQMARRMPRSGPASELIKQMMGLLLLAAAAYFIGTGISGLMVTPPEPPSKAHWYVVMTILAASGVWLGYRTLRIAESPIKKFVFVWLGLLLMVGGGWGARSLTATGPIDWVYYTQARFDEAVKAKKVVMMDFTAEWCLNCKALEHNVLHSDQVVAELAKDGIVPMKVDLTGNNEAGAKRLKDADRSAIPLLVIYDRDGNEIWKSDFYTAKQVLEKLSEAAGQQKSAQKPEAGD